MTMDNTYERAVFCDKHLIQEIKNIGYFTSGDHVGPSCSPCSVNGCGDTTNMQIVE